MDAAPLITVPLPTVTGREDFLERTIASYEATVPNLELLIYKDLPTCGAAWLRGIREGSGDLFQMGADDIEMHPGWWQAAKRAIDLNLLPAARVLNTDGSLQSCGPWEREMPDGALLRGEDFTRSPMFSRAQWEQLAPFIEGFLGRAHYYTDNVFTWAGRKVGMETVVVRGYEYTHHLADVKRGAGMSWDQRMEADHRLFVQHIQSF